MLSSSSSRSVVLTFYLVNVKQNALFPPSQIIPSFFSPVMSVRWSLVFPHHKAKALGKASWNESPYLNACVRDRVLGTYQESPLVAMVVLLSWLQLLGSCAQSFWQRPALWRVWWESLDDQVAAHFCSSHVVTGVFGDQAQCLCSPLSAMAFSYHNAPHHPLVLFSDFDIFLHHLDVPFHCFLLQPLTQFSLTVS